MSSIRDMENIFSKQVPKQLGHLRAVGAQQLAKGSSDPFVLAIRATYPPGLSQKHTWVGFLRLDS